MSAQSIAESFRKLSPPEKIRLLHELWNEIAADESTGKPLSESQRLLLDEWLRQHEENPEDIEPWGKVRKDILSGSRDSCCPQAVHLELTTDSGTRE